MNWGKWIILSFVLFATFIAILVTVCIRQDVSLVAKEYYQDELEYQQQMKRVANVSSLDVKPEIAIQDDVVIVSYAQLSQVKRGELKLFRPSDEKLDQQFVLKQSTDSVQYFKLRPVKKGMYRAQLRWTVDDKEYYLEKVLFI